MMIRAHDMGLRIAEVPICYHPRLKGKATAGNPRIVVRSLTELLRFWWLRTRGKTQPRELWKRSESPADTKWLERCRFIWPQAEQGAMSLTRAQLSMLLEGIDWRQPVRTSVPLRSEAASAVRVRDGMRW
jgi:hypothetical protein